MRIFGHGILIILKNQRARMDDLVTMDDEKDLETNKEGLEISISEFIDVSNKTIL